MSKCSMQKKIESIDKKSSKKNENMEFTAENLEDFLEENFSDYLSEAREYLSENYPDDWLWNMEDISENLEGKDAMDILLMGFNGYDWNPHRSDNKEPFNPNRDYYYLNGYGNLVSVDAHDEEAYYKRCITMSDFASWMMDNNSGYALEDAFNEWAGNEPEEED